MDGFALCAQFDAVAAALLEYFGFFQRDFLKYGSDDAVALAFNVAEGTLSSMVSDGMQNKIYRMPEDAQMKLQETLQKIVNEGSLRAAAILSYSCFVSESIRIVEIRA